MSGSQPGTPPDDSGDDPSRRDRSGGNQRTTGETPRSASDPDAVTIEDDGLVRWFFKTTDESVVMVRDILSSVAIVAVIGLLLFGVSGIWPPLVAVESPSMEPNMHKGDLIFLSDEHRFVGDSSVDETGVVTFENGQNGGYEKFGKAGDVIVFQPNGNERKTPVIHRAHFWVEEDENWVETKASDEIVGDLTCEEVTTCPAKYDGFITKGDNNAGYDQLRNSGASTDLVRPEWITGKALVRIPWLGHIRLTFDSILNGMLVPISPMSPPSSGTLLATVVVPAAPAPKLPRPINVARNRSR